MAVLFKGNGLVFIPGKGRCIRFVNGEYSTDDADEIAVLSKKYEHDTNVAIDATPEIEQAERPKRGRPKNADA